VLTAVWIALWGDLSVANALSGATVGVVCLWLVPLDRPELHGTVRPIAALRYIGFFVKALLLANVEVAWETVTPRNRDNEGIVAVPVVSSCSPTVLMLIVNSIGLTPGTVVVDIGEGSRTLFVHVLHLDDREESRRELLEFERRAIAAFGSDAANHEMAELIAADRSAH
ncbi:MAG: Na+/H+ antiporter subunit E, partial [Acidimicrobiia bacterium]|nr:Na+/H+ antiporter subunit E [Acidimicrobiia bacterium]